MKITIDHFRGTLKRDDGTEVFCPFCNAPCRINCFCIAFEQGFDHKAGAFYINAVCYRTASESIALRIEDTPEDLPEDLLEDRT